LLAATIPDAIQIAKFGATSARRESIKILVYTDRKNTDILAISICVFPICVNSFVNLQSHSESLAVRIIKAM
jgi:hypothetical protein